MSFTLCLDLCRHRGGRGIRRRELRRAHHHRRAACISVSSRSAALPQNRRTMCSTPLKSRAIVTLVPLPVPVLYVPYSRGTVGGSATAEQWSAGPRAQRILQSPVEGNEYSNTAHELLCHSAARGA